MYLVKLVFILFGALSLQQPAAKPLPGEEKFEVNKKKSQLQWMGKEVTGGPIEGTIGLQYGHLSMESGRIKSAGFAIDMNSISRGKGDKDGVVEHLESDDFFSVKTFPLSQFVLTKVSPSAKPGEVVITGKLTIKGVTNAIMFNTALTREKDQLNAKAVIAFNRTQWGITYKSMSFLSAVKSGLIEPEIRMKLDLVFDKVK